MTQTYRMVRSFFFHNPLKLLLALVFVIVAGLLEGVGIITLLPVLGIATGKMPDSKLNASILHFFEIVGIEPTLLVLLSIVVGGIVLKAFFTMLSQRAVGFASADFTTDLRLQLIRNLMNAQWRHFVSLHGGRLSNAIAVDATTAGTAYSALVALAALVAQVSVFSLIALFAYWQVTVIALAAGGLMMFMMQGLVGEARKAGSKQQQLMGALLSRFQDGIALIKPLKAMGRQDRLVPLLEQEAREINSAQRAIMNAINSLSVFQEPIFTIFLASGLYYALTYTSFSLPDLLFIAILFQRIAVRTGGLQMHYQKMVAQEPAYWSLRKLINDAKSERENLTQSDVKPHLCDRIELQDIVYSYEPHKYVLDKISIKIPANRMTAIVGSSGAGKTTLADLIIGLIEPQAGIIRVDGIPLNSIDSVSWRQSLGYLPQEPVLFHDTVRANVTLGDDSISENAVEAALRVAGAWSFVSELSDGLDTIAGERGARFSGGQRQRIALARAMVRKPLLLILDEPTTALDPVTEREICATLSTLTSSTTILAISHQPAIVNVADTVYRIVAGRVTDASNEIPVTPPRIAKV